MLTYYKTMNCPWVPAKGSNLPKETKKALLLTDGEVSWAFACLHQFPFQDLWKQHKGLGRHWVHNGFAWHLRNTEFWESSGLMSWMTLMSFKIAGCKPNSEKWLKRSQGFAFLAYPVNTCRDTQDPWQIAVPSTPVLFPRLICVCNHYRKIWYNEITNICDLNAS